MLTLSARPYIGDADLEAIAQFFNDCAAADHLEQYYTPAELRLEFNDPLLDQAHDLRLWHDRMGELIGFAQLWIHQVATSTAIKSEAKTSDAELEGWLWFRVHPQVRGSCIETEIITWGEQRLRNMGQPGVTIRLRSGCRSDQSHSIQLLENVGFTIDRQFLTLIKSLVPPLPAPQLLQGFTLRSVQPADLENWVELYNWSFVDHWQHHPLTLEEHRYWLENDLSYDPNLDLVAIAPDGTFAALCHCHIDRESNTHRHCNEGWINILGTRRGFRRLGLGRAMLSAGMRRLWDTGIDTVKLGVDTQNPNQALNLYESVGFHKLHTRLSYVKTLGQAVGQTMGQTMGQR